MIPLPKYAKIKDNYCIAYFGNNKDYLIQLKYLRPFMESTFPGVQVYISYRDDASYIFNGIERTLSRTELEKSIDEFAYIRELTCDMKSHPIDEFMKESDIPYSGWCRSQPHIKTGKNVLLTKGFEPVKSLTPEQISKFPNFLIDVDIEGAENVVGVECEKLFEAGLNGANVSLIPTFGENIFKKMFPLGKIIKI